MPTPVNIKASQALRGEVVTVTMDPTVDGYPEPTWLNSLVTADSSGKAGIITRVDKFGVSFEITPIQPDKRFDSEGTPGILSADETIIFD